MNHPQFNPRLNARAQLLAGARKSSRGVALVIVLAFVVLITGLVVAFFSRSMNERQLSNQNASQVKVEELAQGAIDTIIGDLKQEIADPANSTLIAYGAAASSGTLYFPKTAANMRPASSGTAANGANNLVKRSAAGVPFYPGGPARAAGPSSTGTSGNNHYISLARWNSHFLLPKANPTDDTDFTPITSGSGAFVAPDWVLLARDGSSPLTWTANMVTSATNSTSVVGRYAYAIYDEGGLLDLNVAGYPSLSSSNQVAYKYGPSFANLSLLPGLNAISPTRLNAILDNLIGFRNYASAAWDLRSSSPTATLLGGIFPNLTWQPVNADNYCRAMISSTTGFLSAADLPFPSSGSNRAGDHPFLTRQQLQQILLQYIASSPAERANLEQALQYLTHFTRGLSQPSFAPDPNRPKVVSTTGGNSAYQNDDAINLSGTTPGFLGVRVSGSFQRNDESSASAGEPLVKKRFALSRLAWITYKGPSATLPANDPLIQALITNYGYSLGFLQQGTASNIYKYFGLSWVKDTRTNGSMTVGDSQFKWLYNHSAVAPYTTLPTTGGIISRLTQISGRDADFFELLKAGVVCGSKAKAATTGTTGNSSVDTASPLFNYNQDTSLELSIIQIGANIIDQFDLDAFPTRIIFNDGSLLPKEVRGVENLPYLYRVRYGCVQGRVPTVITTGTRPALTDPGFNVLYNQPEVWNPHDPLGSVTDPSVSNLQPTTFRCVAYSIDPDHINNSSDAPQANYGSVLCNVRMASANKTPIYYSGYASPETCDSTTPVLAPFSASYNSTTAFFTSKGGGAGAFALAPANAALYFSGTNPGWFREPTLLISPNVPAGSNLSAVPPSGSATSSSMLNPGVPIASTVPSNHPNIKSYLDGSGALTCPNDNKKYLGFYMMTVPSNWYVPSSNVPAGSNASGGTALAFNLTSSGKSNGVLFIKHQNSPTLAVTYRMQYLDANNLWETYDEKYASLIPGATSSAEAQTINWTNFGTQSAVPFDGLIGTDYAGCYDPRTSRFGMPYTSGSTLPSWIVQANNILETDRPAVADGLFNQLAATLPSAAGWSFYQNTCYPGFLTQNMASGKTSYTDADGVLRFGGGAYNTSSANLLGLSMATATTSGSIATSQSQSRPIVLNRPFRNVGELGYVFSGTPWKNIDLFTPQSGDAGLLDLFCVNDTPDPNGLVAGTTNLNTRQLPVLLAMVSGAYKDLETNFTPAPSWGVNPLDPTESQAVAQALFNRTNASGSSQGPLRNISELVGRYVSGSGAGAVFDGFSQDLTKDVTNATVFGANTPTATIQRFREAPVRAFAAMGQTRVWNLMIDVVAQVGRYPQVASKSSNPLSTFIVEGEQRYWVHVAIDRLTGQVIDRQFELVKE